MSDTQPARRRLRMILLGEFSAGKSTVANALLGAEASPMRVTATHVPPIWYVPGTASPVMVDREGQEREVPGGDVSAVAMSDTQYVRVPCPAPFLDQVEILDMPGSSDPNISADIWDALLPQADLAIWCTPANQAWRQSEAALWEEMPQTLRANALLAITRLDKVTNDADRARVLARVKRETEGLFAHILPLALTADVLAFDDPDARALAGLTDLETAIASLVAGAPMPAPLGAHADASPAAEVISISEAKPSADPPAAVMPRRITSGGAVRRRSRPSETGGLL